MQESQGWLKAPQRGCAVAWADESGPALPLVLGKGSMRSPSSPVEHVVAVHDEHAALLHRAHLLPADTIAAASRIAMRPLACQGMKRACRQTAAAAHQATLLSHRVATRTPHQAGSFARLDSSSATVVGSSSPHSATMIQCGWLSASCSTWAGQADGKVHVGGPCDSFRHGWTALSKAMLALPPDTAAQDHAEPQLMHAPFAATSGSCHAQGAATCCGVTVKELPAPPPFLRQNRQGVHGVGRHGMCVLRKSKPESGRRHGRER